MKYYAVVLSCLLSISFISGMQKGEKQITIFNNILDEITVSFNHFDFNGKACDIVGTDCSIKSGEKRKINLGNPAWGQYATLDCLYIPSGVPHYVRPVIAESGSLKYGDTIIVKEDKEQICVTNQMGTVSVILGKSTNIVKIGTSSAQATSNVYIPQQTLTVRNKNLAQVMVCHAALRNAHAPFERFYPSARSEMDLLKIDKLFQQVGYCLRRGEENVLTTFSSDNHVGMVATLTNLLILQAAQDVEVYINDGQIQSGDTLEISQTEKSDEITIFNERSQEIVARLYTTSSSVTLG